MQSRIILYALVQMSLTDTETHINDKSIDPQLFGSLVDSQAWMSLLVILSYSCLQAAMSETHTHTQVAVGLHQTSHTIISTPMNNSKFCCRSCKHASLFLSLLLRLLLSPVPLRFSIAPSASPRLSHPLIASSALAPPSFLRLILSSYGRSRQVYTEVLRCASSNSLRAVRQTNGAGAHCMTQREQEDEEEGDKTVMTREKQGF